eukprot:8263776-Alexandrium_andersonii.AAC.1
MHLGRMGFAGGCWAWPALPARALRAATEVALTLRNRLPRGWKALLGEGGRWVKPEPINSKRAPGWRRRP